MLEKSSLAGEIWRDIKGYTNYQVSSLGRVKSLNYRHTGKERVMKPRTNKLGYLQVFIYKGGNRKNKTIHRLVAQAFPEVCGETFPGWEVDHINTVRTDNRACNLKVCTHTENNNNPLTRKAKSEAISKPIIQLTLSGDFIKTWPSGTDITLTLGINAGNISQVCQGKKNQAGGFKWKYAE